MKKIVSMLLAVCMCLSVGVMLTACGDEEHTHTYQTEWSKDATHHWHACSGEDCTDIADKAEHTWNDGEITTEATAETDGVKTFTCTTCGQTKTDSVKYTVSATVTKDEWENAFDELIRGSFAITLDGRHPETTDNRNTWLTTHIVTPTTQKMEGVINGAEGLYYVILENDVIYSCYYNAGSDSWDKVEESEYNQENWLATYNYASKESGNVIIDEIFYPYYLTYDSFSYDENTDRYLCEEISLSDGLNNDKYTDIVVSFANGKIQKISCTFFDISSNNDVTAKFTITVSCAEEDIVITLPDFNVSAPIVTVTEEEWENILIGDYLNNVTVNEQIVKRREGEAEPYATTNNIWKHTEAAIYSADYVGDVFSNQYYYVKKDNVWYNLKEKTILGISAGWQGEAMANEQAVAKTFAGDIGVEFVDLYSSFTYNSENKCYEVFEDEFYVKIYIEEGKLVKIEMNSVITSSAEGTNGEVVNGTKIYEVTTYTFSDYGTTTIDNIPEWTVAS